MNITRDKFKDIVARFPTGVTVVTTKYNSKLFGLTVNSFASLSLDPLLVLFCINKSAGSYEAFINSEHFNVSFLSEEQQEIATKFASGDNNKFQNIDFFQNNHGIPILKGNVAYLELKKYKSLDAGDHEIIIGSPIKGDFNKEKQPLYYYNRNFL